MLKKLGCQTDSKSNAMSLLIALAMLGQAHFCAFLCTENVRQHSAANLLMKTGRLMGQENQRVPHPKEYSMRKYGTQETPLEMFAFGIRGIQRGFMRQ